MIIHHSMIPPTALLSGCFTFIVLLIPALVFLVNFRLPANCFPKSLQWVGQRDEIFSKTRASFRQLNGGLRSIREGYTKFSRQGQSFVLPDPSLQPQVMLPQEHIRWLMAQPDTVLSQRDVQKEKFATRYLLPMIDKKLDTLMVNVVRRDVTRNIGKSQAAVFDELRASVDTAFGVDEASWRRVRLFEAMQIIISRSTNRMILGLPLCRDPSYLQSLNIYSTLLGSGMVVAGQLVPWFLRSPVAFVFRLPIYVYKQRCLKMLVPRVRQMVESVKQKRANRTVRGATSENFLAWLTDALLDSDDLCNSTTEAISECVIALMIATTQTSIVSATNVFLDLLSSDPKLGYYECLRTEAGDNFKTQEDWENFAAVARLSCTDSAIRESLRQNPIVAKGSMRKILHKNGLTMPDGHHLSRGAWVGTSIPGVHTDERFYPRPNLYEPFRFVRGRADEDVSGQTSTEALEKQKDVSLATTSDTFLTWGHGRHACPGRWFAAQLLKLMVAYITLNYDIRPLEKRPENRVLGDSIVPSPSVVIEVRRRKHV